VIENTVVSVSAKGWNMLPWNADAHQREQGFFSEWKTSTLHSILHTV